MANTGINNIGSFGKLYIIGCMLIRKIRFRKQLKRGQVYDIVDGKVVVNKVSENYKSVV